MTKLIAVLALAWVIWLGAALYIARNATTLPPETVVVPVYDVKLVTPLPPPMSTLTDVCVRIKPNIPPRIET